MNWLHELPVSARKLSPGFVTLDPRSKGQPAIWLGSDGDPDKPLNPIRLLLVDDDRLSRIMTANLLKANHVEVAQAENGLDALMQCQARPFDVVLTDLRMPIMDGETMAVRLRRFEIENGQEPCRIVALAASLGLPNNPMLTDGTFDAALEKPALIGDVLNAVLG